jgi:hypothetical protein
VPVGADDSGYLKCKGEREICLVSRRRLDDLVNGIPALHVHHQDLLQTSAPSSPCTPVDSIHLLVFDLSFIQDGNVKAVLQCKVGHGAQRSSAIKNFELGSTASFVGLFWVVGEVVLLCF